MPGPTGVTPIPAALSTPLGRPGVGSVGAHEAALLAAAVATLALVEGAISRALPEESASKDAVQLREEQALAGQQGVKPSALLMPEEKLEPPTLQVCRTTAPLELAPADMLAPPAGQTLALADRGPLIRPDALDEAFTTLDHIRADLQDVAGCSLARERVGLSRGGFRLTQPTRRHGVGLRLSLQRGGGRP
ncbi:hypothetical protein ZWY2020_006154 [Hordeum vulgare]|nr:hypothetical protein ZWY2020_006154 [Hordeum vulgare]